MRVARYLGAAVLQAVAVVALVGTALLLAIDALDPTARGQTLAQTVPRALWLAAVGVVTALALAPAAVRTVLDRDGSALALRTAGLSVTRALVLPVALLALAGAPCTLALGVGAQHQATIHPGNRPQPLDVVPWGAPATGCWERRPAGMAFVPRLAGTPAVGCAPGGRAVLPWLLALAALLAGPCTLVATAAARSDIRGAWAGAGVTLLTLVVGVVAASHGTVGGWSPWHGAAVVAVTGALATALGRTAGRALGGA